MEVPVNAQAACTVGQPGLPARAGGRLQIPCFLVIPPMEKIRQETNGEESLVSFSKYFPYKSPAPLDTDLL